MEHFLDLVHSAKVALADAQELQVRYDAVGWQIQRPSYAKARHIMLHLVNVTASLGRLVEHVEHVEHSTDGSTLEADFTEVMAGNGQISASVLFHALQLAALSNVNVGEELVALYQTNAKMFAPESDFATISP